MNLFTLKPKNQIIRYLTTP